MTRQISDLLEALDSESWDERLAAIRILGEIGDERALQVLRERLKTANEELSALIVAVGKLKDRLRVK